MQVIRSGDKWEKRMVTCPSCKAVLLVERADVVGGGDDAQFRCPECRVKTKLNALPPAPLKNPAEAEKQVAELRAKVDALREEVEKAEEADDDRCPAGGTHVWYQGPRTHECRKCGAFSAR